MANNTFQDLFDSFKEDRKDIDELFLDLKNGGNEISTLFLLTAKCYHIFPGANKIIKEKFKYSCDEDLPKSTSKLHINTFHAVDFPSLFINGTPLIMDLLSIKVSEIASTFFNLPIAL